MSARRAEGRDVEFLEELARGAGLHLQGSRELAARQAELWAVGPVGKPLGFALGWVVADELEVLDVAVSAHHRRRGLGRLLLEALLMAGRGRGANWAHLEVRASNVAAQRLYVALGFERVGERLGYYGDGEDAWLFRRCLSTEAAPD